MDINRLVRKSLGQVGMTVLGMTVAESKSPRTFWELQF